MGSSFEEVYCLNYMIKRDTKLERLTPPDLMAINWRYLQYAIAIFSKKCYPAQGQTEAKVLRYIPFSKNYFEYVGDGFSVEFTLSIPKIADSDFYIVETVGDISRVINSNEYTYDIYTNSVVFNNAPSEGANVQITNYYGGSFLDELEVEEKVILSEGMNIPYKQQVSASQNLLNMAVNGQIRMNSQAEHLYRVEQSVLAQVTYVDRLINDYSYTRNPNSCMGLSGLYS